MLNASEFVKASLFLLAKEISTSSPCKKLLYRVRSILNASGAASFFAFPFFPFLVGR